MHGDLYGNDNPNHCHGEGYVQVIGDPTGTPLWILAAVLLLLGRSMLAIAVPYGRDWEVDRIGGEMLHSGPVDR